MDTISQTDCYKIEKCAMEKTNKLAVTIDKANNTCHCILDQSQMSAQSFATFIQAEPALQPLFQQLSELGYMQKIFQESIPASFAKLGQVGSFREGILNVVAKNGAAAAKLKQIAPSLEEKIAQILRQPVSVKVSVLLDNFGDAKSASRKVKPVMSKVALESLQKLAAELPTSPLKDEVATLLKRQGRRRIWDAG
jgi:Dna[CI] antecedent, DciA